MEVRPAAVHELSTVMTVFDAALLETSVDAVGAAIEADRVLVADDGGALVGAVWLVEAPTDGARIEAVAVRPGRRGQGVGTALVDAAAEAYGRLVAEFDGGVRPFWDSLGFEVQESTDPGRFVGVNPASEH